MKTLEEVKKAFEGDLYATQTTGIEIDELGENYAKCSLILEKKHKNAWGITMGGAIYTLSDFAFAVASNIDELNTVTTVSNISFINAVKGDVIYANAKCLKDGKKLVFYEVEVTDNLDTLVANVTFTGTKLK